MASVIDYWDITKIQFDTPYINTISKHLKHSPQEYGPSATGRLPSGGDTMPAVYEIKFLPGGETLEIYGSRGDSYEFEDGTQIGVISKPVWCRWCRQFTDGESIEDLEEIDQLLTDLHDRSSEVSRGLHHRLRIIEQMEQRRRWLSGRLSPPKCLECGSTEIVVFRQGERTQNPAAPAG